ncbi:MAG TPA: hypothetical protein VI389_12155, partial [Geobacteraceae bacterium]
MTGILAKGVPLLFLWGGILLLLQRAYGGGRRTGLVAGAGYLLGGVAVFAALASGEGEGLYAALRIAGGGWFLLLFLLAARFAYHGAGIAATDEAVASTRFRGVLAVCWS